ncbi:MAG: GNAT family protein [Aquidulcibacter sp.]|uniref:GNAT family N-acetyltransferase n=1 Tax=Aquidulcibacter sp. TaxID=2052990 RepID=UPI0022CBC8CC|nr:GNAT family protein [Aquidulcibacter sp.]
MIASEMPFCYEVKMLILIPFSPSHFSELASWFASEADVVQWGGPTLCFPLLDKQLDEMLVKGQQNPPARLCWMAEKAGALVGHVQLAFDWRNGNAVLSRVALAPKLRRQGLAAPMVALAIHAAFDFETIQRLELNVYSWNVPAIKTYQNLGFQLDGVRRSSALVSGERWDTAIMSLLRGEWQMPHLLGSERPSCTEPGTASKVGVV